MLTPEEARKQARNALAGASKGEDPSADRHAERADLAIAQLVERYLADGPTDKPTKKASSREIDASNPRRHVVPILGSKSMSSVTTADVQRFQRAVTDGKTKAEGKGARKRGRVRVRGGSGTAWRATVVLAGILAWAVGRGPTTRPRGVRLNKLTKRERFLAIVRLLILTGARKTEIAALRWDYVGFERGGGRRASQIPRRGRRSSRLGCLRWTCWPSCRAPPPRRGYFRLREGRAITLGCR